MIGVSNMRHLLVAMVFTVGFVLLIVCADVANLRLARSAARAREISIRITIGAGRARILRQLLMESVLLAAAGGLAGWLVAAFGLRWFQNLAAQGHVPSWLQFSIHARASPIWPPSPLRHPVRPRTGSRSVEGRCEERHQRWRARNRRAERGRRFAGLWVGFQMVLCVVLLAGAGLMIHSTVNLYQTPTSFNPSNILTMRLALPETKYAGDDSVSAPSTAG